MSGFGGIWSELALMDLAARSTPRECESLGFFLMISARNFALGGSDVIGAWLRGPSWTIGPRRLTPGIGSRGCPELNSHTIPA